ncbi:MAG: DUF1800 domain-containing protein, partial [Pseudomonadota bacterium]
MPETDVAQIRFGYGFRPQAKPLSRAALYDAAAGPDRAVAQYPGLSLDAALGMGRAFREAGRDRRNGVLGAERRYEGAQSALRGAVADGLRTTLARVLASGAPLRERLTWFWADHFTVAPQNPLSRATALSFADDAIRPHLFGPFAGMLKAVLRHPSMLVYLDQFQSIGPQSRAARRSGRGLNENLARELLELHTLGTGSGYTQTDVRAAAELLTGLSVDPNRGFVFRPFAAQPGAETVLGKTYGSGKPADIADIDAFLDDLAVRPETARHIARKLAIHFVADDPPEALTQDLEAAYRDTEGDLGAVTRVLLDHPETDRAPLRKVKTPFEFIASALTALGFRDSDLDRTNARALQRLVTRPLAVMGQPFMRAPGPDGWSEDPAHWITPQGLATRISWSVAVAARLGQRAGDPRFFLNRTLGDVAGAPLRFAVSAAETQAEGIAIVLASA